MPEPLKDVYTRKYIRSVADVVSGVHKPFDREGFVKTVFGAGWKDLELKQRIRRISASLGEHLPHDYGKAIDILVDAAPGFTGFEALFCPDFVEVFGVEKKNWKRSLKALEALTEYSSSEMAIRPFILADPEPMMKQMLKWSRHENEHVRRLASEGCRPRLPWAMALPFLKKDPAPVFPIIDSLIHDESEYVRRSAANNLNDISKDNARPALAFARHHSGASPEADRAIKHGLRTLLKAGDKSALKLTGIGGAGHVSNEKLSITGKAKIGGALSFALTFDVKRRSKLRIEYRLYFLKNSGMHYGKVFKWTEKDFGKGRHVLEKKHSFKLITTRKYYPGDHHISVIMNGEESGEKRFVLTS